MPHRQPTHHRYHRDRDCLSNPVLVLNAAFEAVSVINVRDAIRLLFKGAATVVESHSTLRVRTSGSNEPAPDVIRLVNYHYVPRKTRSITPRAVKMRDGMKCQYCLQHFDSNELTMDHIIPKSRGGPTAWKNIVAACKPCNNRKRNRTPEEAGMVLARKPVELTMHARHRLYAGTNNPTWDKYLYV